MGPLDGRGFETLRVQNTLLPNPSEGSAPSLRAAASESADSLRLKNKPEFGGGSASAGVPISLPSVEIQDAQRLVGGAGRAVVDEGEKALERRERKKADKKRRRKRREAARAEA